MTSLRTCVGCRGQEPRGSMLRVVARSQRLFPDPAATLPGRGAWIHADVRCLEHAERRRAWARALRLTGAVDDAAVRAHLVAAV